MLSSPTSPLASSSSSSSASTSTLQPEPAASAAHRRRSVDNGGLSLALNDHSGSGSGKGWGGWEVDPAHLPSRPTDYAELVLAMREQTATAICDACPCANPSPPLVSPSELEAERISLIHTLSTWHFDTSQLSPDDALKCASLIFESLWSIEGMQDSIGIEFETIHPFLTRISKIYRRQTSYHNFQHAVDVLQAVYCYLHAAGCVPGVHILLDEDPPPVHPVERKFDAGIPSPENPNLPPKRRRNMWRPKPPPEGKRDTLLKRALRNQDIFALCVAAIGHDIAHPGVSNKFLSNAKAPLAELFDDVSVLEKFHCTVLLHVMRTHHMAHLLDRPSIQQRRAQALSTQSRFRTGSDPGVVDRAIDPEFLPDGRKKKEMSSTGTNPTPSSTASADMRYPALELSDAGVGSGTGTEFRELLMQAILATDMSVHFKWMSKLDNLMQKVERNDSVRGSCGEGVDYEIRLLLSQALIKCADISNPSRPVPICKHWSSSLNSEWAEQALLEKQLELPISVMASDDPIQAGKAQVAFIETFTLPLLQATSAVIPEMVMFVNECNVNLDMWKTKVRDSTRSMNGVGSREAGDKDLTLRDDSPTAPPSALPTSPPDVSTMFALSLPCTLHAPGPERTQPSRPDRVRSPSLTGSQSDHTDSYPDEPTTLSTPSDSRSPSPPPPPPPAPPPRHRRTLHSRLPQVSIPQAAPASLSNHSSTNSHAKSSSTTTVSSPLFSPRSIPTSSSSPRSDSSSGGSLSSSALRVLPSLRAAYEANGRPKPMRRLENRFSWQGYSSPSSATVGGGGSSRTFTAVAPPPPPLFTDLLATPPPNHPVPAPPHVSNGS